MKTYLKDKEGNLIEVTDLDQAIHHVAAYLRFLPELQEAQLQAFAKKRQIYWKDLFQKLAKLKNRIDEKDN